MQASMKKMMCRQEEGDDKSHSHLEGASPEYRNWI
jgi:hypothetical protein